MRTNGCKEPEVLAVDLLSCDGKKLHLENDGVLTVRPIDEVDDKSMLQTRSAFRGFVATLTELMNYTLVSAYGYERGEEGGEG